MTISLWFRGLRRDLAALPRFLHLGGITLRKGWFYMPGEHLFLILAGDRERKGVKKSRLIIS